MTCVKIKDLSPEDRKLHSNKHQKKYDGWKKITQEFHDILREETKEEKEVNIK
jgi:hypothetical protein